MRSLKRILNLLIGGALLTHTANLVADPILFHCSHTQGTGINWVTEIVIDFAAPSTVAVKEFADTSPQTATSYMNVPVELDQLTLTVEYDTEIRQVIFFTRIIISRETLKYRQYMDSYRAREGYRRDSEPNYGKCEISEVKTKSFYGHTEEVDSIYRQAGRFAQKMINSILTGEINWLASSDVDASIGKLISDGTDREEYLAIVYHILDDAAFNTTISVLPERLIERNAPVKNVIWMSNAKADGMMEIYPGDFGGTPRGIARVYGRNLAEIFVKNINEKGRAYQLNSLTESVSKDWHFYPDAFREGFKEGLRRYKDSGEHLWTQKGNDTLIRQAPSTLDTETLE